MGMTTKKCYKKYSPAALAAACDSVLRREMALKDACAHYGIPLSTLHRKISLQRWGSSEKPTWTDIRDLAVFVFHCQLFGFQDRTLCALTWLPYIGYGQKSSLYWVVLLVPPERGVISLCTDTTLWIFWRHLSSE